MINRAVLNEEKDIYLDENFDWSGYIQVSSKNEGNIVKGIYLDKILADLPKVDFIRFDIQGSEMKAIKGAMDLIKRSPDCILTMEYETRFLNNFHNTSYSLRVLTDLEKLGYFFFKVSSN